MVWRSREGWGDSMVDALAEAKGTVCGSKREGPALPIDRIIEPSDWLCVSWTQGVPNA